MSKGQDSKKSSKKEAIKSPKEKKADKKLKKVEKQARGVIALGSKPVPAGGHA